MNAIRQNLFIESIGRYDTRACLLLNRASHRDGVRLFFSAISRLGDGIFWYALMAVLAITEGAEGRVAALHMLAVGLVGFLVYKVLKGTFVRQRPFAVVQQIRLGTAPLDVYSFPSGHTLHAVAFTVVALGYYPMLAWLLVPFTLLVAASRVVLGLHYPTDVLAGAAIGSVLALTSFGLLH